MQGLWRRLAAVGVAVAAWLAPSAPSLADGFPRPWEIGMQPAAGPVKAHIIELHDLVLVIITIITLFVGALLLWVMFRYNARRNPTPSRTSHNTIIEVAWTVLPVLILVVIAIPSFRLVYYQDRTQDADLTVKVTGHQWYWEYTYPDKKNLDFSSYIVPDDQLKPGQKRLLDVDNQLVVPAGKPGTYYGECNQICGQNHSRMPIAVHAIPADEFDAWVDQAKTKFSDAAPAPAAQPASVASVQR